MADQKNHHQRGDIASEVLEHLKNPPVEIINPHKNSGSKFIKYLILAIVFILLLGAGGFAVWKFLLNDDTPAAQQSENDNPSTGAQNQSPVANLSDEYTSDRLLIDFKHPSSWKVEEDGAGVMISSPEEEITDINGDSIKSEFKILIKQGADRTDSEYLGRGLAIKKSSPLKYGDPAPGQREETFVTDFGLDGSDNFAYFIVQGNFELKKDETLGPDFASEADAILVSGGFYSADSADRTKLASLAPADYQSNENYKTALEIIKTLQLR